MRVCKLIRYKHRLKISIYKYKRDLVLYFRKIGICEKPVDQLIFRKKGNFVEYFMDGHAIRYREFIPITRVSNTLKGKGHGIFITKMNGCKYIGRYIHDSVEGEIFNV